jgi:tetratricopeptide (TPR) repeat protein
MPDTGVVARDFSTAEAGLAAAEAARAAQGVDGAVRILTSVRDQYPGDLAPTLRAYALLCDANRADEADAWLTEARARFPQDFGLAAEHARSAHTRRDFAEAARRWDAIRGEFPDQIHGYTGGAAAQRELGQWDAAEALAQAARERFPQDAGALIELGLIAHARRDWPEAARRWETVRAVLPDHAIGSILGAHSLREAGQPDAAETLLSAAVDRFPREAAVLTEYAWLASHRRDFPTALQRWEQVRARFPNHLAGYTGAAVALREMQQLDAADAMLADAVAAFPNELTLLLEHAGLAQHRRDWEEAARRWALVRQRAPDHLPGHIASAVALREAGQTDAAEAVLADAVARFPDRIEALTEYAWLAQARQDWPAAVARWRDVREKAPDILTGYVAAAHALRRNGQVEEAERLLAQAIERFPAEAGPLVDYASAAAQRNDWPEAIRRWRIVIERLPEGTAGYQGLAFALRVSQRIEEGEGVLRDAMARFADDAGLPVEYAWLAFARRDWEEALRRWEDVRARFPHHTAAFTGLSHTLRELGRLDDAEEMVAAAVAAHPDDGGLMIEHASLARHKRNWPAAVARWEVVRTRYPGELGGYVGAALALRELRRLDEADALLEEAMRRFPFDAQAFLDYGEVATRRGDWSTALQRLIEAQRRFPGHMPIQQALHEAQSRAAGDDPDLAVAAAAADDAAQDEMRAMLARFTSLGGDFRGCEFGEVQRHHGVEPLGLLRWTEMLPEELIAALEARFEGVGQPENTDVYVQAYGEERVYQTADKRFGIRKHTFVQADDIPLDKMKTQSYRLLQVLARKLVEDLQTDGGIFVYKTVRRNLTDSELAQLYAAVRTYGAGTWLLYVRYTDEAHPDAMVEVAGPGLLIGYLERFGVTPTFELSPIPFASWTEICRQAYALSRAEVSSVEVAAEPEPTPKETPGEPDRRSESKPARGFWQRLRNFMSAESQGRA